MQSSHQGLFLQETSRKRTQHGAFCWRLRRDNLQVLLVTSRDTGRWVIPKGWPHADLSPMESAKREAWEEAGVEGVVDSRCLGLFSYNKGISLQESIPCVVSVYGLRVHRLLRQFPERKERSRKWFTLEKAAKRVAEPELRAMMLSLKGILPLPDLNGDRPEATAALSASQT